MKKKSPKGRPLKAIVERNRSERERIARIHETLGQPHDTLGEGWRSRTSYPKDGRRGYRLSEAGRARLQRLADQLDGDASPEAQRLRNDLLGVSRGNREGGIVSSKRMRARGEASLARTVAYIAQLEASGRRLTGGMLARKLGVTEGHARKLLKKARMK